MGEVFVNDIANKELISKIWFKNFKCICNDEFLAFREVCYRFIGLASKADAIEENHPSFVLSLELRCVSRVLATKVKGNFLKQFQSSMLAMNANLYYFSTNI